MKPGDTLGNCSECNGIDTVTATAFELMPGGSSVAPGELPPPQTTRRIPAKCRACGCEGVYDTSARRFES